MDKKRIPIGIEDFEKIRTEDYYYIDKTILCYGIAFCDKFCMVKLLK